jgi:hypothetical protein
MKQTAVEWLEWQLGAYIKGNIDELTLDDYYFLVGIAKEMEKEQMIAFGKKCFYKGFDKAENDDANCFTAWREEAEELITKQQEQ